MLSTLPFTLLTFYMLGLLYFGRLDEEKGVDGIIDMIKIF
jgi:hypothetical protein